MILVPVLTTSLKHFWEVERMYFLSLGLKGLKKKKMQSTRVNGSFLSITCREKKSHNDSWYICGPNAFFENYTHLLLRMQHLDSLFVSCKIQSPHEVRYVSSAKVARVRSISGEGANPILNCRTEGGIRFCCVVPKPPNIIGLILIL